MAKSKREKRSKRVVSARKRVTEHQSGVSLTSMTIPEGKQLFQVKAAKTFRLDILPYEVKKGKEEAGGNPYADEGELHYERTYYVHRGIGPDSASYVCLSKTFREPCPVCEARAKMARDPEHDEEEVKNLAPKERQLFNVIDLDDPDKGVQLFEYSHFLFGKALDAKVRAGDDGEYDLFADLEQGMTVKATFEEEKGGGYSFFKCSSIELKPRKKPYDEDILEEVADLDEVPRKLEYKELKKIYEQLDEEDEEDEKPVRSKKGAGKQSKLEEDDDEDEEEDSDDDEDDSANEDSPEVSVGDTVTFTYREKERTGEVINIVKSKGKEPLVYIECEDREEPYNVDLSEVELVEEEEAPPPKSKGGRPKKKVEVEEDDDVEDEEDEEEEEDEEDEEEAPPVKRKPGRPKKEDKPAPKKKGKPVVEEEEEEEDDDDQEDDDEWDD